MKRRELITFLGGAAVAWPLKARAQQPAQMRRIGALMGIAHDAEGETRVVALREGLRGLGWEEGRNVRIEYRWTAGQPDRIQAYARELVSMQPDVIFCSSAPTLVALRKETRTISIVFVLVSDPVGMGQVESLARPGGNATGFTPFEPSLGGKWIELLKEISPGLMRVAAVHNPATAPNLKSFLPSAESAASMLGVVVTPAPIRDDMDIERTVGELAQPPSGGLILLPDPYNTSRREQIASVAARHRVPLIGPFRYFATAGGLASYGVNPVEQHRRAALYIDRILRGERPGELPVQAPTKFELVINLKTAKTLGLDVPPTLLARADDVIE